MDGWYVNIAGFAGDRIEGPLTSAQAKRLFDDNTIHGKTPAMHPVETNSEWVLLTETTFRSHIDQRREEEQQKKEAAKRDKKEARREKKHARQEKKQLRLQEIENEKHQLIWEQQDLARVMALPAEALYYRGSVTCGQCNRVFGEEMLLNGADVACRWCGMRNHLPLNPNPDGQRHLAEMRRQREVNQALIQQSQKTIHNSQLVMQFLYLIIFLIFFAVFMFSLMSGI